MESAVMLGGLIGAIFTIVPVVLWIWTLVDILKSDFHGNNKIIWILVVLFLFLVGSALYYFVGRGQKIRSDVRKVKNSKDELNSISTSEERLFD